MTPPNDQPSAAADHPTEPSTTTDPTTPRRRRHLRLAGIVGSSVLVLGTLTAGGVVVAHRFHRPAGPTAGPSTGQGFGTLPAGQFRTRPAWNQQPQSSGTDESTSDASASASSGLVEITSTTTDGEARGTGMILTSSGEVVTNHHVVAGATKITVTDVATSDTYRATYVGSNTTLDVAVLRLQDASGLTPVITTGTATVGESVNAVGDANGDGGSLTAAPGTITATDRSISVQDDDGTNHRLTGLIEIAADIVPGDSGGAVESSSGQVLGMNVAASSGSPDVTGYAIPIGTVLSVVNAVDAGTETASTAIGYDGYLGVEIATTSSAPVVAGVVDGGAADDAGITAGDTITSVDGTAVTTETEVHDLVGAKAPGDRVTVGWTTSSGTKRTAIVILGTAPIA